jgi:hypothetical protein
MPSSSPGRIGARGRLPRRRRGVVFPALSLTGHQTVSAAANCSSVAARRRPAHRDHLSHRLFRDSPRLGGARRFSVRRPRNNLTAIEHAKRAQTLGRLINKALSCWSASQG